MQNVDKSSKVRNKATEMKYLKHVREVSKNDRVKNVQIGFDLKVQSILEYIEQIN